MRRLRSRLRRERPRNASQSGPTPSCSDRESRPTAEQDHPDDRVHSWRTGAVRRSRVRRGRSQPGLLYPSSSAPPTEETPPRAVRLGRRTQVPSRLRGVTFPICTSTGPVLRFFGRRGGGPGGGASLCRSVYGEGCLCLSGAIVACYVRSL